MVCCNNYMSGPDNYFAYTIAAEFYRHNGVVFFLVGSFAPAQRLVPRGIELFAGGAQALDADFFETVQKLPLKYCGCGIAVP